MQGLLRHLLSVGIFAASLSSPRLAQAWIEKRIESSTTTLELGSDGAAIVRYELSVEVRGAPLKGLELRGVDSDAEPLADGTITRMQGATATSLPLPVQVRANNGHVDVHLPLKQGFRGRSFLLKFGYRTQLLERQLIRHLADGQRSELGWVGPRFDDGVDSVTLVVRTAAAAQAPEVVVEDTDSAHATTANFGIVMSTLRRSQRQDELELVRSHVARDEPITWRVLLDRKLFFPDPIGTGAEPAAAQAAATQLSLPAPTSTTVSPRWPPQLPWIALAGVAYGLMVLLKAWIAARAAHVRHCQPRAWVGWKAPYRAAVAGLCLASAGALVIWGSEPTLAALALVLAIACAALRRPEPNISLRGPGVWQTLDAAAFRAAPSGPALPGAWLDAGRPQGFLLLMAALSATTWLAARSFEISPYYGACILLGSSALLPLFCTGRAGELPLDPLAYSRRFLRRVQRRLRRHPELVVKPIGRFAAAEAKLDELRLSIIPERGLPGLIGLELGLEFQERLGGFGASPVVVVRAAEGSACQRALPRGLAWTRGRSAEERATLVRPKLPTLALSVGLIQELLAGMRGPEPGHGTPSAKKAAKSSGRVLSTAKAGTRASPAHAT